MSSLSLQRALKNTAARTIRSAGQEYRRGGDETRSVKSRRQLEREADKGHELHRRATLSPVARLKTLFIKVQISVIAAYVFIVHFIGDISDVFALCQAHEVLMRESVQGMIVVVVAGVITMWMMMEAWLQGVVAVVVIGAIVWNIARTMI